MADHTQVPKRTFLKVALDWPSTMESMERRKAKCPKLINGAKENFENKGRIPSTSASSKYKRVFSVAGNTVTPKRTLLNPEKVEVLVVVICNLELLRILGMKHQTCLFSVLLFTGFNYQKQLKHIKCFDLFHINFLTELTWHLFQFNDCICFAFLCFALLNNIYFFFDQLPGYFMDSIKNYEKVMAAIIQRE